MWKKEVTDELVKLTMEYEKRFRGTSPEDYDELYYDDMTYAEFVGYIKKCLATGKEMPDVVP